MIRVTIESLPGTGPREVLAHIDICNVSSVGEIADYTFSIKRSAEPTLTGVVIHHVRSQGFLPLVAKVFAQIWRL